MTRGATTMGVLSRSTQYRRRPGPPTDAAWGAARVSMGLESGGRVPGVGNAAGFWVGMQTHCGFLTSQRFSETESFGVERMTASASRGVTPVGCGRRPQRAAPPPLGLGAAAAPTIGDGSANPLNQTPPSATVDLVTRKTPA